MSHDQLLGARRALAALAGRHFGGDRDLYATMGYPRALTVNDYADQYARGDIAARIVDAYPDATWREPPTIEAPENWAEAFQKLDARLRVWQSLHRLDRLAGLGHYGILYLGLDGRENPATPATRRDYRLLYLQPHSERTAQVVSWEDDPTSPRYGKPKLYRLTTGVTWTGSGAGQKTITVHHSRVIHVAERALEDLCIGTPRLRPVWNRLLDLDKLLGGSAEIYWQNSAMLLAMLADSEVEWDPEERKEMAEQLEAMQHGLRRALRLRGVDIKNVAPGLQGSDPSPHIDKQLDIIAGTTGIPKRILVGSEAGELASSQDEQNFAGQVATRRENFAKPMIVEEFFRRMAALGVLPGLPETCWWEQTDSLGEAGRADVVLKKTQAAAAYSQAPGIELILPPDEFRAWLGEEPLEALPGEEPLDEDDAQVVEQFTVSRKIGPLEWVRRRFRV